MRALMIVAVGLAVVLVAGGTTAALAGARTGAPGPVPGTGAGSSAVTLSPDAVAYPGASGVQAQLQRYFDAINEGDYATWATTVAPDRADRQPERSWKAAYRSTKDGTIRIDRIDGLPGDKLLVRVRFVSTQDLADAPADLRVPRICWQATLPMTGRPPRISSTQGGSSVKQAC